MSHPRIPPLFYKEDDMARTVGELVIYGTSGVCRIEDLRDESFAGAARRYYILRPLTETGNTRIYVPADNEALVAGMQELLSGEVLIDTVVNTPAYPAEEWPQDGRARNKRCKELLSSGNRECLIRLVKTVKGGGQTPTPAEESACLRAAAMLYQEFSLSLELDLPDMIPFLLGEMIAHIRK